MRLDFRPVWIVTRREIRDQFRDWRIIAPILGLTLFFPGLMNFTARSVVNYVQQYDVPLIGDRLIPFLLMVVGFFPISVSLVIALESFVGEKERRSIEPLLSSPLTDWQLYLGKLLAVMVPPLMASYIGITVYLIGVHSQVGWLPDPALLIQVLALSAVQAILMVSGAVVISSQTTSARAANLLASFIIVPMALLLVGESMVMFWARYAVLWWAILGQMVIAGLLVRTGIVHFNREELLGRELDSLNIKWVLRTFVNAFVGNASSPWNWYRQTIQRAWRQLKMPLAITLVGIGIGFGIGVSLARTFALPPEVIDMNRLQTGFAEGVQGFEAIRFFTVGGVGAVWTQNVRALLLGSLFGLFSFGVLGALVTALPFAIIGYFTLTVASAGISPLLFLAAFVLPHGILEIPAIVLGGAAILRLGATLSAPAYDQSIGEALLVALADWARILLALVFPLLLIAAFLEVFVTPQVVLWVFGG